MRFAGIWAAGLVAGTIATADAQGASSWKVETFGNPMQVGDLSGPCARQGDIQLCLSFQQKGVFFLVTTDGLDTLSPRFPTVKVDGHAPYDAVADVVLESEARMRTQLIPRTARERLQYWRGQVPSPSGAWEEKPPMLVAQMIEGEKITVRVYIEDGAKRDAVFPLAGFCAAAAKSYVAEAPALQCPNG